MSITKREHKNLESIMSTNNPFIDSFIFETLLITPIEKIIFNLKKNEYRDCDVTYLNNQLKKFTSFAMETLNRPIENFEIDGPVGGVMNDYNKSRFLKYFEILLNYFKHIIKNANE